MADGAFSKSDWEKASVRGRNSNPMRAKFMVHLINGRLGWEAGTRTPIRRSRVCSLTIRRPPNRFHFTIRTPLLHGSRPHDHTLGKFISSIDAGAWRAAPGVTHSQG